jgi:signal peptidase I
MNTNTPPESDPSVVQPSKLSQVIETLMYIVVALIVVIPIRYYVAQPFIVDGNSMYPTFHNGEYLIVNETVKLTQDYHRGDPVIIHYPNDPSRYFIKRLIGLPGETINIKNGVTTISGPTHKEPLTLSEPYVREGHEKRDDTINRTLGPDEFFVMGDNRKESFDSRFFGTVPRSDMDGRPIARLFPFGTLGLNPGSLDEFANPYESESAKK